MGYFCDFVCYDIFELKLFEIVVAIVGDFIVAFLLLFMDFIEMVCCRVCGWLQGKVVMRMNFSIVSQCFVDVFVDCEVLVNIECQWRYIFWEYYLLINCIVNMMCYKLDLQCGDNVVVILDNDNVFLIYWFIVVKVGMVLCYINYCDSLDDYIYQVDMVNVKVVFIEVDLLKSYYEMLCECQVIIVVMDMSEKEYFGVYLFWELLEQVDDSNFNVVIDDCEDVVIMCFIGGIIGCGKCVMYFVDIWLVCWDFYWVLFDFVWSLEICFIYLVFIIYGSGMMFGLILFKGGCIVIMNVFDLEVWCDNIVVECIINGFVVLILLYCLLDMNEEGWVCLVIMENMFYGVVFMSFSKLVELQ